MMNDQEYLKMGFQNIGVLKYKNGNFKFEPQPQSKVRFPGVYLWLQRKLDGRCLEVMYVGKAGNGAAVRMKQHLGGLRLSNSDRIDRIKSAFGVGDCLEIWFRKSEMIQISDLYKGQISSYSTEEEALITRFNPLLNRAKTPSMRANHEKQSPELKANIIFNAVDKEITSTNGVQRGLWEDAVSGLAESHKRKIGKIISLLEKLHQLENRWPTPNMKVVGHYSGGRLPNQSMLVFGEIKNINFKPGSKVVYISLENELIAFPTDITEAMPVPPDEGDAYSLDALLKILQR